MNRAHHSQRVAHNSLGPARRGIALLAAIMTLVILASLLAAISWQIMAHRRMLAHRQDELQAAWLARSGIEHAAARLLADPAGYAGEEFDVIEDAFVRIKVIHEEMTRDETSREPGAADVFRVTCEARYLSTSREPVFRSETRRFRRVVDGETVRLQCLTGGE